VTESAACEDDLAFQKDRERREVPEFTGGER
jgi:hypothetical protein